MKFLMRTYQEPILDNSIGPFGARFYDRTSWTTIDPLAEKYYSLSPYNYCSGNPIIFVDRDGRDIYRYDDKTGVFYLEIKNNDSSDQVARFRYNMKEKSYSYKFIKHKKDLNEPSRDLPTNITRKAKIILCN